MMFAKRIGELEERHRAVAQSRPVQDSRRQLQTLMNYETPVTAPMLGRLADMLHKVDALAERDECLPLNEYDEAVTLCGRARGRGVGETGGCRPAHADRPERPLVPDHDHPPHAPHRFHDGGGGGKTAVYMARWVNTRGEKGPWSDVTTATVAA